MPAKQAVQIERPLSQSNKKLELTFAGYGKSSQTCADEEQQ
jgi:hypothetical protein